MTAKRKIHEVVSHSTSETSDVPMPHTASSVTALIVGAVCWSLLPIKRAEWIIERLEGV